MTHATWKGPDGVLQGLDPIPKPTLERLHLLIAGHGRQELAWIATNADAWITLPSRPERAGADRHPLA